MNIHGLLAMQQALPASGQSSAPGGTHPDGFAASFRQAAERAPDTRMTLNAEHSGQSSRADNLRSHLAKVDQADAIPMQALGIHQETPLPGEMTLAQASDALNAWANIAPDGRSAQASGRPDLNTALKALGLEPDKPLPEELSLNAALKALDIDMNPPLPDDVSLKQAMQALASLTDTATEAAETPPLTGHDAMAALATLVDAAQLAMDSTPRTASQSESAASLLAGLAAAGQPAGSQGSANRQVGAWLAQAGAQGFDSQALGQPSTERQRFDITDVTRDLQGLTRLPSAENGPATRLETGLLSTLGTTLDGVSLKGTPGSADASGGLAQLAAASAVSSQTGALPGGAVQAGTSQGGMPQANLAAPVSSPAWPAQLGQQLVSFAQRGGEQQIQLNLHPAELGPLSVTLKVTEQGTQAHFLSAHGQVRQALEQAIPQLRDLLADQGIALGDTSVSDQRQQDDAEQGQRADLASTGQAGGRSDEGDIDPGAESMTTAAEEAALTHALNGSINTWA